MKIFSICSGRRKTLGLENFLMSSSVVPSSVSISCLLFTTRLLSLLTGSLKKMEKKYLEMRFNTQQKFKIY